ncbi:PR5-like receptor kinase [Cardamine amara subsp. amara]|uniref:PR5-like receptor kinase n=1 Tax=Cardamine amara subsp. amara TaxID=228776 RepID=A0ABD1BYP6_CARAN
MIPGVSAALTVVIIIVVAITVRTKHVSDWNEKNVDAVVMLKRYSYTSVKKMTKSFAHVLGKGGFGTVYKGKLPESGQDVAVKILKESEGNGEEFINEVASMSRTSHVNIVSLLGFCYERNKRAIIYELMPNGSLDKFISENMSTKKEWKRLYDIAVGVSRGLEYLHNRCVSRIVHFDIKLQNILMDKNLCPKISDFGLAKLCKNKESIISMLDARGTAGYIAPEVVYKSYGGASHKSDVYSYGMVVLEMIGARNIEKVENAQSNNSSVYFPDWIYKDFERGEIMRIFGDQITEEEEKIVKKMVLVGLWCIQTNPSDRPPMIKVIEMLEGNLEDLQVPPKPVLYLPTTTVPETLEDSNETSSFSYPSQFERGTLSASEDTLHFSKEVVHETVEESQHRSRSS